jgi:hypothetical protein
MLTIDFKRGDTFQLNGTYKEDGVAQPLPSGIRSQLRDATDALVCELTVLRTNAPAGLYALTCADTSAWVPGRPLYGDVQFTNTSGAVVSMASFMVNVIKDQTHD